MGNQPIAKSGLHKSKAKISVYLSDQALYLEGAWGNGGMDLSFNGSERFGGERLGSRPSHFTSGERAPKPIR
jgi:hypothetical protein